MVIDKMLQDKNITRYKLSKLSGVPQSTIRDICSGKTSVKKCEAGTLYKISKVLDITVDEILRQCDIEIENENRSSFDVFKSNVCHYVKDMGQLNFILNILENNTIRTLYNKKWYPEALYLLAMTDYISKLNSIPLCTNYNDIRAKKLEKVIYPSGVLIRAEVMHDESIKLEAKEKSIPEFMKFNIVENEVWNIV